MTHDLLAFIGGGNMASAIIGGLVASGPSRAIPFSSSIRAGGAPSSPPSTAYARRGAADAALAQAAVVVWAVKPQRSSPTRWRPAPRASSAARCSSSVMAGIRSDDAIVRATGSCKVRNMPNTPAPIGQGIAGRIRAQGVSADERRLAELVARAHRSHAVGRAGGRPRCRHRAVGSGRPTAHFVEAMMQAAQEMGLSAE